MSAQGTSATDRVETAVDPDHIVHAANRWMTRQVLLAQAAGVLLLAAPSAVQCFAEEANNAGWLTYRPFFFGATLAALATAAYYIYVYRDQIPVISRGFPRAVDTMQRHRSALGLLIFVDCGIVASLIGLSGGLRESYLASVLILVPPTAALIRRGGRTVVVTSLVVMAIVVWEALASERYVLTVEFGKLVWSSLGRWSASNQKSSMQLPHFELAEGMGISIGIVLFLMQSRLDFLKSITPRVSAEMSAVVGRFKGIEPTVASTLEQCVRDACVHVAKQVSLTNEPELHASVVHPFTDLALQACVLAHPGVQLRDRRAMQRAARMVFAMHWLDDVFDSFCYHRRVLKELGPNAIEEATVPDLARACRPYGVERVMAIVRGGGVLQASPPWTDGIDVGIIRVVMSGVMQSGSEHEQHAASVRVRRDLVHLVEGRPLRDRCGKLSRAYLWASGKTAMPLVLGCYWSPTTVRGLGEASVVLDAAFLPLLLWHNWREEQLRENVPGLNRGTSLESDIDSVCEESMAMIQAHFTEVVASTPVWREMREVLRLIYHAYGPRMPKRAPYNEYSTWVESVLPAD